LGDSVAACCLQQVAKVPGELLNEAHAAAHGAIAPLGAMLAA